ncbi:MAG: arabinofuranosyltransferase [Chlamydiales bacterium]|jgi:arabinofuranosyltransferase
MRIVTDPNKLRTRMLAAAALALIPFLALVARFNFVCDDAFISFRYARNFAAGLGLVFNPGVTPPVEGYSEFLWVLLISIAERIGWDPGVFARVFSIASGIALILSLGRRLLARFPDRTAAPMGALLFAATLPPLAVWSTGGMATMPFAWAVFACYDALFGEPGRPRALRATVFACLVVLLRADGAWWVAAVAGAGLACGLRAGQRSLLRASFITAAFSLLVFGAHVGWRFATYGEFLPNTAQVKLGVSARALERGGRYIGLYLLSLPSLGVALLLILGGIKGVRKRALLPALVPLIATWLYALLVGGDFMCYARFLVPSLPFMALLLAAPLASIEERFGAWPSAALAATLACISLLPAFAIHPVPENVRQALRFRWNSDVFESEYTQWARMSGQAAEWRDLGIALRRHSKPGDSLVLGAVGAVGYYSGLFIYDRNGLVTREVAMRPASKGRKSPGHDKAVPPEFFIKDQPTFLDAFLFPTKLQMPKKLRQLRLRGPMPTDARHPQLGELALYVRVTPRKAPPE